MKTLTQAPEEFSISLYSTFTEVFFRISVIFELRAFFKRFLYLRLTEMKSLKKKPISWQVIERSSESFSIATERL
jgi:hypothetical protein